MFAKLKFNSAFPNASRSGLRAFSSSLCFMIAALLSRQISEERNGKPVDDIATDHGTMTGHEIDAANDQTDQANGRDLEVAQREEQGHVVPDPILVTAARLKMIYDWVAAELAAHARKRRMMDHSEVPDSFHLATSIEDSLNFRATAPIKLNEAAIKEKAEMYGLPEADIRGPLEARAKRQQIATQRDAARIVEMFHDLVAKGDDGHELEAEACFERLHPLYQTRVLVAADKALFNAYKQAAADDVSGTRQDAAGDAMHLNGMRFEIRQVYQALLKNEKFNRELNDALSAANAPVWAPEPRKEIRKAA